MSMPLRYRCLRRFGCLGWIPRGIRYRVARFLADPDRMPDIPFECDFGGLRYGGSLASYIDWNVWFLGVYEPEVLAFLVDAASQAGAVAVDVGANVGQHSLYLAPRVAQVVAFEPWPQARAAFMANLERNGLDNVDIRPVALGDIAADLQFFAPSTANLGTGSFVADVNRNLPSGTLPVVRGDDALADLTRIDVIKIDTEGFEAKVLTGLAGTLRRHRPAVLFEMSDAVALSVGGYDGLENRLLGLFGDGWRLFLLKPAGTRYRLLPFAFEGGHAIAVAVPPGSVLVGFWRN